MLRILLALAAVSLAFIGASPAGASPVTSAGSQGSANAPGVKITPYLDPHYGKSHLVPDSNWLALKMAHKIYRPGQAPAAATGPQTIVPECLVPCPQPAKVLDYSSVQHVDEPQGSVPGTNNCVYDNGSYCYVDKYMWGLCGPGATAVTLYYWNQPTLSYPTKTYSDPHTSTTWNSSVGRSYIMYLATQTNPPAWNGSPGEEAYHAYPGDETYVPDVATTLNWEASGHTNDTNYFYAVLWYNQFNQGQLHSDIVQDIWYSDAPVAVDVNAQLLPNWTNNNGQTHHFITIVGYDDGYNNGNGPQYYYMDTCGYGCNNKGSSNGVYEVSQATMYNAIENNGGTGAIIW
jgi:hypothetical protein